MKITFKDAKSMDRENQIQVDVNDMLDIQKLVGGDGFVLYTYYFSKRQRWKWVDTVIAKDLSWSIDKLKRIRSKLSYNGLFHRFKMNNNIYTYVGGYNALKGKIDELIEHGHETYEAIGIIKGKIDTGEINVFGNTPSHFDYYETTIA